MWLSNRVTTLALGGLLLVVLAALAHLYPLAARPLVRPGDMSLVERAHRDADAVFAGAPDDRDTFPIVIRMTERSCVELRSTRRDESGNYLVCYDNRSGEKIEERATVGY